jgi:predicted transcriptional regulator
MRRKQVQLTDEQLHRLEELAERQKRPVEDVIRESVDTYLARTERNNEELRARAIAIAGKFRSGLTDLAQNHDEYFAQAIEEEWKR